METRRSGFIARWLTSVAVATVFAPLVAAQSPETTSTVHVRVVAPARPAVPAAVRLEAEGPTATTSFLVEIAATEEAAIFRHVPAGAHRLSVTLAGFEEATSVVIIAAGATHEFAVDLRPAGSGTAGSEVRLVQSAPSANERVFDRAALASFPGDDPISSIVETAVAPVIVDRMSTGGLWIGGAALVGGQAGSWRQTSLSLGALDVTDPVRTGTPLVHPSWESVEAVSIATAMLGAALRGPGPSLSVVPRSAGSTWGVDATTGFMPNAWQASATRGGVPSIARFASHQDASVSAGGGVGERADLFLSSRVSASTRLERDDPLRLETRLVSLLASTTRPAGSRGAIRAVASLDRAALPYPGRARFADRDVREHDVFGTAQVTWDRWASTGAAWSVSAGFARAAIEPEFGTVSTSAESASGVAERLRDGPVPTLFEVMPGTRTRWSIGAAVGPRLSRLGWRHAVAAGVNATRNAATTHPVASPPVGELVDGLPARLWAYGFAGPDMRWASTELTAYLTDRVILTRRLRADLGLRLESVRGGARDASNAIAWLVPAPRLGVRWAAGREGRFALYGGYAHYAHRLPLDYFAYGDPAAVSGAVYRWTDGNGDRRVQADERGVLIARVGPGTALARIDPDLQAPYTRELAGGIDIPLGSWTLHLVGIDRHERHLVGLVNTGVPAEAYVARSLPDLGERYTEAEDDRVLTVYDRPPSTFGRDRYLLTNPPAPDMEYLAWDVTLDGAVTPVWRTRFDGTAYHGAAVGSGVGFSPFENDQGVIGAAFADPNAGTYARGHPHFDRGYVVKWWSSYTVAERAVVSAVARYQDGLSFSRLVVVPDLSQGPEAIQAYRRGRTRFTYTFTLDVHAEKAFMLGRATVAGIIEAFNLLNTRNEVEEDVVTRASFRAPTALQPPRAARVAVRVSF